VVSQLPMRYQVALWVVGFLACVGAGAWLAFITPLPVVWQYGAIAGAVVGPALVAAFCRSLTPEATRPTRG
jgi:hypothetical protein